MSIQKNYQKVGRSLVGKIGEDIACEFLVKRGHEIIRRNYRKYFGELDIVTKQEKTFHFVEVKTVSREITDNSKVTDVSDEHRAEDNVHPWKLKRLHRTINAFLCDVEVNPWMFSQETCDWVLDVIVINIDLKRKLARIKLMDNIVA